MYVCVCVCCLSREWVIIELHEWPASWPRSVLLNDAYLTQFRFFFSPSLGSSERQVEYVAAALAPTSWSLLLRFLPVLNGYSRLRKENEGRIEESLRRKHLHGSSFWLERTRVSTLSSPFSCFPLLQHSARARAGLKAHLLLREQLKCPGEEGGGERTRLWPWAWWTGTLQGRKVKPLKVKRHTFSGCNFFTARSSDSMTRREREKERLLCVQESLDLSFLQMWPRKWNLEQIVNHCCTIKVNVSHKECNFPLVTHKSNSQRKRKERGTTSISMSYSWEKVSQFSERTFK